jgi:hypothetical protein
MEYVEAPLKTNLPAKYFIRILHFLLILFWGNDAISPISHRRGDHLRGRAELADISHAPFVRDEVAILDGQLPHGRARYVLPRG